MNRTSGPKPKGKNDETLQSSISRTLDRKVDADSQGAGKVAEPPPIPADFPEPADLLASLFLGAGIDSVSALAATRGLQRYYARYGIFLSTAAEAERIELRTAVSGSYEQIDTALRAEGIPVDGQRTDEQERRADEITAELLYGSLRSFLGLHAFPPRPLVNVVIIEDIIDPALSADTDLDQIAGLAFSQPLFERLVVEGSNVDVYRSLRLDRGFTPTLFVGLRALERVASRPDEIIGHELGHALGLTHSDLLGNLMRPVNDYGEYRPVLTPSQITELVLPSATKLRRWSGTAVPGDESPAGRGFSVSGLSRLFEDAGRRSASNGHDPARAALTDPRHAWCLQ